MKTYLDIVRVYDNNLHVQGWAFGKNPESEVTVEVSDGDRKVKCYMQEEERYPVEVEYFPEYFDQHGHHIQRKLGFVVDVPAEEYQGSVDLILRCEGKSRKFHIDAAFVEAFANGTYQKQERLKKLFSLSIIKRGIQSLKESGVRSTLKTAKDKMNGKPESDYDTWYQEAYAQRFETYEKPDTNVKFGIVIPVYRTPEKLLRKLLESLREQTYENFEVYVADASDYEHDYEASLRSKKPVDVLKEYAKKDSRFHYEVLQENAGIAQNTNKAIDMGIDTCDFIVLADHDDELTKDALYRCAQAIAVNPQAKILYSDEDKTDLNSLSLFEPHFKPDYNPDLLRSVNYITHLFVVESQLLKDISETDENGNHIYEKSEYDGAQDYDLILRACEKADEIASMTQEDDVKVQEGRFTSSNIIHIPYPLYHWRMHEQSTSFNPESKMYAYRAGEKAVYDHCKRIGLPIEKVEQGTSYGYYHPVYEIEKKDGVLPLISVIIPNKDHAKDLDVAIRSLIQGEYKNLEFIVVENNSTEKATFDYYHIIQKEFPEVEIDQKTELEHPVVKVVRWEREFNYSAINNYGVQFAHGEYLLFLNNDIEMIESRSLFEMLSYVQRNDVGICGARLYYPNDTIQHGGVIVGMGGIAGGAFVGTPKEDNTYMHRCECVQDLSAVTAACLLSKKSVFEQVGGFDETLAVAFNDIDYCMKVRKENLKVVYNPYAVFYHYESISRGAEDTPEKVKRFNSEIVTFANKWHDVLYHGDPYYNQNLTLEKPDFSLKNLELEKIGAPFPLEIIKNIVK